jgi:phosphoglucomutase
MPSPDQLATLVRQGHLLPDASANLIALWQQAPEPSVTRASIEELLDGKHYAEINDRFFRHLAFGTGGIRGRTIGRHVTTAERGAGGPNDRPQFAAVGTNTFNEANLERATRGLCRHLRRSFPGTTPTLVIAHDTRHFSADFAELAARVALSEGVNACLFPADRSTPQLSFTVRYLNAQAGVVLTASHNPPHDNGFKAYWDDGGQLVEPHATAVIEEFKRARCQPDLTPAEGATLRTLGPDADDAYLQALETLVLDRNVLLAQAPQLKVVFTPIHGTGARCVPSILRRFSIQPHLVAAQSRPDGRFPTVKSPNPENVEALALGQKDAERLNADLVIGTDPDADRMGCIVRAKDGSFVPLTGNQIASILAHYRVSTLFAKGILTRANAANACLIKTFVTTDLIQRIGDHFGVKVVNTLTGFKYIGAKLLAYEHDLMTAAGAGLPYRQRKFNDLRSAHLQNSCYFVFGGEESYGYSGGDYVRDKDANASVLMLAEAACAARARKGTLLDYLDAVYKQHGYFLERLGQVELEGAEGAAKIKRMLASFQDSPPASYAGAAVSHVENFSRESFADVDGIPLPRELMLRFHLTSGARVTVRGSGTEPKVKFYLSACHLPDGTRPLDDAALSAAKSTIADALDSLWTEVRADALQRAG